jgi:hypothetical protein
MSDWMLPPEAFAFLRNHLPPTMVNIVELGSGDGTVHLREFGTVYSIEHDEKWLRTGPGMNYIHAPIVNGWYDPEAIRGKLPAQYDCIIVDGPPGDVGRGGMLEHLDLFRPVPLLVDDVQRLLEVQLAAELARSRNESMSIHHLTSGRAFATIGWDL